MYRFALRPRWIVSHVLVLALVVTMVNLGFWQLRRLDEKQSRNALVEGRAGEPELPIAELAPPGSSYDAIADVEFRRTTAVGEYDPDGEVLVRGRSRDGAPGSWVLTPLVLAEGGTVVVNRGWISNSGDIDAVPEDRRAPDGEVRVEGLVRRTERRGSFGARDPEDGTLTNIARVDVARLDQQIEGPVVPAWLQLVEQAPAVGDRAPDPIEPPTLDEGPHFGYAMQWFIFSAIALVGYPLILRRAARDQDRDADDGGAAGGGGSEPAAVPATSPT